ncbi:MAG: hypothetical protein LQ346_005986, partial [Caloplaca aetnensis]
MPTANNTNTFDINAWIQRGPPTTITPSPPLPSRTLTYYHQPAYPAALPALPAPLPSNFVWTPYAATSLCHGPYHAVPPAQAGYIVGPQIDLPVRRGPSPAYNGYSSSGPTPSPPANAASPLAPGCLPYWTEEEWERAYAAALALEGFVPGFTGMDSTLPAMMPPVEAARGKKRPSEMAVSARR